MPDQPANPDEPIERLVTIGSVLERADELLENDVYNSFFDGVVSAVAHTFADHADPPRLLSEHEHDLARFAGAVALALDEQVRNVG